VITGLVSSTIETAIVDKTADEDEHAARRSPLANTS
jgi:hypothetical protein